MEIPKNLLNLGFTRYEAQVYLSLIADNPLNGSQLSRGCGVPRANIYNVLDGLKAQGIVMEVSKGLYAPIPPEELLKRLKTQQDKDLSVFKSMTDSIKSQISQEYIWTITGYEQVMAKAVEMLAKAEQELFIRLYPKEAKDLEAGLKDAAARGVDIKYVSFGPALEEIEFHVVHPEYDELTKVMDGRSIEVVVDYGEVIVGRLENGPEKKTTAVWAQNHSLAFTSREVIRHDFYHVFLYKLHELGEPLSEHEKEMYQVIKNDLAKTYHKP